MKSDVNNQLLFNPSRNKNEDFKTLDDYIFLGQMNYERIEDEYYFMINFYWSNSVPYKFIHNINEYFDLDFTLNYGISDTLVIII